MRIHTLPLLTAMTLLATGVGASGAGDSQMGALTTEELVDTYIQDSLALRAQNEAKQREGTEAAEQEFIRQVSQPPDDGAGEPARLPDIPDTAMFRPGFAEIPGVPFELNDSSMVGFEQLFSYDGQTLTFSVGDLPGLDMERLGDGFSEGPIQMIPRPEGGFDFSITPP